MSNIYAVGGNQKSQRKIEKSVYGKAFGTGVTSSYGKGNGSGSGTGGGSNVGGGGGGCCCCCCCCCCCGGGATDEISTVE